MPGPEEKNQHLSWGDLLGESRAGVSRSHSDWAVRCGPGEGRKDQGAKLGVCPTEKPAEAWSRWLGQDFHFPQGESGSNRRFGPGRGSGGRFGG